LGEYLFGLNNVWAMKRFVEPDVWVEIAATKMDVNLIQFSLDLLDPVMTDEVTLKDMISRTNDCCKKYGVTIQSCFTGILAYATNHMLHPSSLMRENAFDWYSKAATVAKMLGAETLGGHIGTFTQKDFNDQQRKENLLSELIERLVSLSRIGKDCGLNTILWEPMPVSREPPSSIQEARTLLTRVNKTSAIPIQLCIDLGHTCNPNASDPRDRDPYRWLSELGSYSPCVHLQQTDGIGDRHWPFTKNYNKVGIIDAGKVISSLDKARAGKTYLYLESIPAFEQDDNQVIQDIVDSVTYWKNYL